MRAGARLGLRFYASAAELVRSTAVTAQARNLFCISSYLLEIRLAQIRSNRNKWEAAYDGVALTRMNART